VPPADDPEHGWLIERDPWGLDALLFAERLDFCFGQFLDVHGDLGAVEHNDAAFATGAAPHDGHEALLTGKDGVVRQRKPEPTSSRRQAVSTKAGNRLGWWVDYDV
jgi:hypothetical protein